jgi:uncharacterized protein
MGRATGRTATKTRASGRAARRPPPGNAGKAGKARVMGIIRKHYTPGTKAYMIYMEHARLVASKALEVAGRAERLGMRPDRQFVWEAAMLHDMGIFLTRAPMIGCRGEEPYVRHGLLGAQLLRKEGLPRHALVAERHIGTGISKEDVTAEGLPLPKRDMVPVTLEEKIVCFADKFFTKRPGASAKEMTIDEAREDVARYRKGDARFQEWLELFGYAGKCEPREGAPRPSKKP